MKTFSSTLRTAVPRLCLFAAGLILGPAAHAGAILTTDANGELLGATGVEVDGSVYDVMFSDLRGMDLFQQADGSFDFGPVDDINKARFSVALSDQVLLGQFDESPELTFGCEAFDVCRILTAFRTFSSGNIGASVAVNFEGVDASPLISSANPFPGDFFDEIRPGHSQPNTRNPESSVWAVWTPAQPVPAPGTLSLLVLGGLAMRRRRSGH